jgi:hypothetical protein
MPSPPACVLFWPRAGLSQRQLAARAHIPQQTVNRYTKGQRVRGFADRLHPFLQALAFAFIATGHVKDPRPLWRTVVGPCGQPKAWLLTSSLPLK